MSERDTGPISLLEELTRHEPWNEMSAEALRFLLERLETVRHPPGAVLFDPQSGEPSFLWILGSGRVERIPSGSAQAAIPALLAPGACFPVAALLARAGGEETYRAREAVVCHRLPAEKFRRLYERSAALRQFCLIGGNSVPGAAPLEGPLADVVPGPPLLCPADAPMAQALKTMREHDAAAVVVIDPENGAALGVLGQGDALDTLLARGTVPDTGVAAVLDPSQPRLAAEASTFEGALALLRSGRPWLLVTDGPRARGLVSLEDLFPLSSRVLASVAADLARAADPPALRSAARGIFRVADRLMDQGLAAEQLTGLIACLVDLLSCRIVEQVFGDTDLGGIEFCWLALGSEGRREQTLVTDQDNGLIFVAPAGMDAGQARDRVLPLAQRVNRILDECGIPLCPGEVMAGNPRWCASLSEWQASFAHWIDHGDPESLLHSAIFFDFRPVCGAARLARELRVWLAARARANPRFLHQMAANALNNRPPLGLLRDFTVDGEGEDRDTVNLKLNGAGPLVDAARILGLAAGVEAVNSAQRLRQAAIRLQIPTMEAECWVDALHQIQRLRLQEQRRRLRDGRTPGNRINPYALHQLDRQILKEALRQVRLVQARLALDYQL